MRLDEELADRLARVRERIAAACRGADRKPEEVTLVGVAKRQPVDRVVAAIRAGLDHVAESFAQEGREKIPKVLERLCLEDVPAPRWHFVGQLQRNKARLVVPIFDCVHSIDRASLAEELDRRAAAQERRLDVLLQVNLSREAQKGGVEPEALPRLLEAVASRPALSVIGLMTVPAADPDPEKARPAFAELRRLRDALGGLPGAERLRELSMGMSADFPVAIEEGSTLVRIGTAVFGPRPTA